MNSRLSNKAAHSTLQGSRRCHSQCGVELAWSQPRSHATLIVRCRSLWEAMVSNSLTWLCGGKQVTESVGQTSCQGGLMKNKRGIEHQGHKSVWQNKCWKVVSGWNWDCVSLSENTIKLCSYYFSLFLSFTPRLREESLPGTTPTTDKEPKERRGINGPGSACSKD